MSIRELEEEIIEIEKVKEHYKPGCLEWNNIDAIINEKKRKLSRLKTQKEGEEDDEEYREEHGEEDDVLGGCEGNCGSGGGIFFLGHRLWIFLGFLFLFIGHELVRLLTL